MHDEEELLESMVTATEESFSLCLEKAGKENILGFSICSDDSGVVFSPRVATKSGMDNFKDYGTEFDFLYNPDNWDKEENTPKLDDLHSSINALYEECEDYDNDDNWHAEYRNRIYQLAVRTMEKLNKKGLFSSEYYLSVWVSDSDIPFTKATSWSKRLNAPEVHLSFVEWLDARAD
ncbi:DUF4303 domain-containing protein [Grimontia kaedaensis]|uniref:DUF4303 domain-containing protein n=1 Tax=Grimontia kaedaensis TaxID=2872157 RepID=A0ABY4X1S0_9GAMM|nr:DUF4303 domain-containing protein [Grimontia kaedaensis]USH05156.1 DUF4303 domain-containing protein [Grimontia kaedaensis]